VTEPEIPQKKPYPMQVEAGKEYHVCMCGKSQNQPLCDGSHAGSGLGPKVFKATEAGFVAFCGCKHSKDETGKCDGTHAGSGLGPKVFKATEAGFVAFCGCKHSKDETGKCDGTHSSL